MKAGLDAEGCYKTYLAHKAVLNENELASARSLDKHLLGYATGALVLSLTFIHEVAPKPVLVSRCWLLVSWCFLCATVVITLVSFSVSRLAFRRQADIWDAYYKQYLQVGEQAVLQKNPIARATDVLTYIAMGTFILGIISFLVFGYRNFPK